MLISDTHRFLLATNMSKDDVIEAYLTTQQLVHVHSVRAQRAEEKLHGHRTKRGEA